MSDFVAIYGVLIVTMCLAAILALSLYLPLMAGQLSLASPGFYAIGGYIAAILSTKVFVVQAGEAYPIILMLLEMVVAAIVCGVLAIMVGIPALRLRGIYLALATIAFVEIVRVLSLSLDITGGAIGIFNIPQPFSSTNDIEYLWLAVPLLLASAFFVYRLERSRVGRALIALREDELAADAIGVNPTYYKVLSFTLGAILAGIVGVVSAHFLNTWNARQGTFDASISLLAFVLIGGSRTFVGPIVGGMLLTALPEVLRAVAGIGGLPQWLAVLLRDGRLILYGLLIVICTLSFPQGLITPELLAGRKKRATALPTPDPAAPRAT